MQYPHLYANFRKVQADLEAATDTIKAYESRNKELASKGLAYKQLYMQMQAQPGGQFPLEGKVKYSSPDAEGWQKVMNPRTNKHTQQQDLPDLPAVFPDEEPIPANKTTRPHTTTTTTRHRAMTPSERKYHMYVKFEPTMVKEYNNYWINKYGKNIHFKFFANNVSSLSATEPSSMRNERLKPFLCGENLVGMNGYTGVGGDLITEMKDFKFKDIIAVQLLTVQPTSFDERTFKTLEENVDNFLKEFPVLTKDHVIISQKSVKEFLTYTSFTYIDFLSLDPPWVLKGDKECTPAELIQELKKEVFDPMGKWIVPKVISIKTRFGWEEMEGIMSLMPGYRLILTIRTRPYVQAYHYHCLLLDLPEHADVVFSEVWHESFPRLSHHKVPEFTNDPRLQETRGNSGYLEVNRIKRTPPSWHKGPSSHAE